MNTRAETQEAIMILIYLVIVGFVLVSLIFPLLRAPFGTGGTARTAEVTLDAVQKTVLGLIVQTKGTFAAVRNVPLFLPMGFDLIAFNAQDALVDENCFINREIARPPQCPAGQTCLCLRDVEQHLTCRLMPSAVVFLAPANYLDDSARARGEGWNLGGVQKAASIQALAKNAGGPMAAYLPETYGYENLLLKGRCTSTTNEDWETQKVYMERFSSSGTDYVYIARESPKTALRYAALQRTVGISLEAIGEQVQKGELGDAIINANEFLRRAQGAAQAAKTDVLLGRAWEKLAQLPEAQASQAVDKITNYDPAATHVHQLEVMIPALGFKNALLRLAAINYARVLEEYRGETAAEKMPEAAEATVKAFVLYTASGAPEVAARFKPAVTAYCAAQANPEIASDCKTLEETGLLAPQ